MRSEEIGDHFGDQCGDLTSRREWADLAEQLRSVVYRGRETVSWSLAKPILEPVITHTVMAAHQLTTALSGTGVDTEAARAFAIEVRDQLDAACGAITPLLIRYLDERGALLDKLAGVAES